MNVDWALKSNCLSIDSRVERLPDGQWNSHPCPFLGFKCMLVMVNSSRVKLYKKRLIFVTGKKKKEMRKST